MSGAFGVVRPRLGLMLVVLVCSVFALRALLLIDATGLWSDELYTVGKSFQPDYGALVAMLRQDTHPPLYYSLLWLWGAAVGQSAVSLRLLSWLAYGLGAVVMVAQARHWLRPPTASAPWLWRLCWRSAAPIRCGLRSKERARVGGAGLVCEVFVSSPPITKALSCQ